ncbi:hypothetical protein MRX96_049702 [Rhipicephalus microplus]
MRRWVSEGTANTTAHRDKDFRRTTTAGNAYATDDVPNSARAPRPAEDVSVEHLTYSINSSHARTLRDKDTLCKRHQRRRATAHRVCQSEGQLRPTLPAANTTPVIPALSDDQEQETTLLEVLGTLHQGLGRQTREGVAKGALSPKLTGVKAECTRRDVATATDTLPPYGRWGHWIGGEKLLMVGAALLSILLIASAAATTASIADRRSTAVGVAPTDPLLPGLIPFTESPEQGDFGTVYSQASAKTSWKSTTDEEAEETDSTTEEPATGYGNASGDLVAVEDPLAMPFRRAAKPECGAVFYTYCRKPRREFLYRASLNACLAAADDHPAQLCNRGTNRFSSWRDCERKCVLTEPPHEPCEDKTLLVGCRRQDVRSSWWWFDGRVCLAWNFPAGGCPCQRYSCVRNGQSVHGALHKPKISALHHPTHRALLQRTAQVSLLRGRGALIGCCAGPEALLQAYAARARSRTGA